LWMGSFGNASNPSIPRRREDLRRAT
jgi:hypothetical protein